MNELKQHKVEPCFPHSSGFGITSFAGPPISDGEVVVPPLDGLLAQFAHGGVSSKIRPADRPRFLAITQRFVNVLLVTQKIKK